MRLLPTWSTTELMSRHCSKGATMRSLSDLKGQDLGKDVAVNHALVPVPHVPDGKLDPVLLLEIREHRADLSRAKALSEP